MTLKYLLMAPNYCKHLAVTEHGDGAIAGTFLLTDAKLRGSAVRGHGFSYLGAGFSGELDMALQWTHSSLIDEPPAGRPKPPFQQLDRNKVDDRLKFGNW